MNETWRITGAIGLPWPAVDLDEAAFLAEVQAESIGLHIQRTPTLVCLSTQSTVSSQISLQATPDGREQLSNAYKETWRHAI